MKNKRTKLSVFVTILFLIGLVSYMVYDKFLSIDNIEELNTENNNIDTNKSKNNIDKEGINIETENNNTDINESNNNIDKEK